jgi:phosphoribosylaminoimidazole-succinocarboxamide synthase
MTLISQRLEKLLASSDQQAAIDAEAYSGLDPELFRDSSKYYRGKVRDLVIAADQIQMIHSDRLTAFDRSIAMVPYKGVILCAMNHFWLQLISSRMPTHLLTQSDERTLVCRKTTPVKIEVVVRGYLAGSMARAYASGERCFAGVELADGLSEFQCLKTPIVTPTTKAAVFEHDEPKSADDLIAAGACSRREWDDISRLALELYAIGAEHCRQRGWMLVDTKYEFGRLPDGQICVIDEVHTPDSSRFWVAKSYAERIKSGKAPEMFDKEPIRRWLIEHGFSGYGDVPKVPPTLMIQLAQSYLYVAESLMGRSLQTRFGEI